MDLGNASLSWYRLFVMLHAGRFQKWTLGMQRYLIVCVVCTGGLHGGVFRPRLPPTVKRESKSEYAAKELWRASMQI